MAEEKTPFADVRRLADGFSIPLLKWRELLFIGALRRTKDRDVFLRDATRPLPPFHDHHLFPEDVPLRVERVGARVWVRRERS